jgi:hypothetical protein
MVITVDIHSIYRGTKARIPGSPQPMFEYKAFHEADATNKKIEE